MLTKLNKMCSYFDIINRNGGESNLDFTDGNPAALLALMNAAVLERRVNFFLVTQAALKNFDI
jgi:hypothetical protein